MTIRQYIASFNDRLRHATGEALASMWTNEDAERRALGIVPGSLIWNDLYFSWADRVAEVQRERTEA